MLTNGNLPVTHIHFVYVVYTKIKWQHRGRRLKQESMCLCWHPPSDSLAVDCRGNLGPVKRPFSVTFSHLQPCTRAHQ